MDTKVYYTTTILILPYCCVPATVATPWSVLSAYFVPVLCTTAGVVGHRQNFEGEIAAGAAAAAAAGAGAPAAAAACVPRFVSRWARGAYHILGS